MDGKQQAGAVEQLQAPSRLATLGLGLIAILAQLALADAAIETFWGGSPIRWWVTPPALGFVALSVWMWRPGGWAARRWGWSGAAPWSIGSLLVLLTVTAWLPEGQVNGVRMASQPASTVLTAAIALAVLLAAYVLVRGLGFLPKIARLVASGVVILLAIYALAALGVAIRDHATFASLFQGGAVWQHLPRWLQGTFIGVLVLLPLAILAQIARFAETLRRQQPVRLLVHQTTALVTALVMAASGVPHSHTEATKTRAIDASPGLDVRGAADALDRARQESIRTLLGPEADTAPSANQTADKLEIASKTIEELLAKLPRVSFDVLAVVNQIGQDPLRLFEWVRDDTVWVPYRGELRGATGVLMDRVGNSLDRALLLAALLKAARRDVRLAHGRLASAQVDALISAVHPPGKGPAESDGEPAELDALAKGLPSGPVDANTLRSMLNLRRQAAAQLVNKVREAAEAQSVQLLGILPKGTGQTDSIDREAVADHWWVQMKEGTGWTDLDPSLPASPVGATLTAPSQTIQPGALPRAMRHQVAIRVVVEQLAGSRLSQHVALDEVLTPAEIIGVPVRLANVPLNVTPTPELLQRASLAPAVVQWAQTQTEWQPVLMVGNRAISQKAMGTTGELLKPPAGDSERGSRGVSAPPVGNLSGLLGGAETPEAKPIEAERAEEGELTAEWIEYEIRVPGKRPSTVRREVFDLVGPAERHAGPTVSYRVTEADRLRRATGLLSSTELVVLAGRLSREFVMWRRAQALLANKGWMMRMLRQPAGDASKALFESIRDLRPIPGPEFDLAVARDLWSPSASDTYLAEPNVIALHKGLSGRSLETLAGFAAFDIVWNEVAARRPATANAYELRVKQGVFDSITENTLMAGPCCGGVTNTQSGALPDGSARGGWAVIRSPADVKALPLAPDSQARIAADIAAGYVVVAPALASDAKDMWWRVDPSTGGTLAIGGRGWGQGFVDYVITSYQSGGAVYFVFEFFLAFVCVTITVIQGIRHHNLAAGAIGIVLCTVASAFGFAGAATTSHIVHATAWRLELLHYFIETYLEGWAATGGH